MTTARQAYEAVLIELNKENAPNIMLEDFNYLFNKAIYQYTNKRYNVYDISQQTTDDLRVLKATALLDAVPAYKKYDRDNTTDQISGIPTIDEPGFGFLGATYEVTLPSDYYHILNCICIYKVNKTFKCYNKGDYWRKAATRLTADAYSLVLDNFYLRPTYKRPYYYIHNVNLNLDVPTNPWDENILGSTDAPDYETHVRVYSQYSNYNNKGLITKYIDIEGNPPKIYNCLRDERVEGGWALESNSDITKGEEATLNKLYIVHYSDGTIEYKVYKRNQQNQLGLVDLEGEFDSKGNLIFHNDESPLFSSVKIGGTTNISNIERAALLRYGNKSQVRLEVRYGADDSLFKLLKVYIDYLKTPQNIRLTQAQLDKTEDTSQVLEFPDYVCQEIVNELVHIIMENISDLRIQTHPVVSQSIANPAQQLTQELA